MADINKKRILVTGASGFIGKYVVKNLENNGFEVISLVRKNKGGFNEIIGDIKDVHSLEKATHKVDGVVHLAAMKADEKDSFETNVIGAKNLVEASLKNKVRFIINVSSSSTKIKNKGEYARTKDKADEIISGSGIPYTTLKPSIVYGDMTNAVFGALAKYANWPITPVIGNGNCVFWPIHAEDLAEYIKLSILNNSTRNKVYDIGGPEGFSINQIIKKISSDILHKKVTMIHIPKSIGLLAAKSLSFMKNPPITQSNVLGSTQDIEWDMEKAFTEFGFTPITFDKGLTKVKNNYLRNEANIIYNYIYSTSGIGFKNNTEMIDRYFKALKNNGIEKEFSIIFIRFPFLLGPIDAATRLFYPSSILQKRLQLATTLVECDTQSANWLLPKNIKRGNLIIKIISLGISAAIKMSIGTAMLSFPSFIKKHAN